MADEIDRAQDEIERATERALAAARRVQRLPDLGTCHYCGEPLRGRLFCDAECRDGWERERAARQRSGGF